MRCRLKERKKNSVKEWQTCREDFRGKKKEIHTQVERNKQRIERERKKWIERKKE